MQQNLSKKNLKNLSKRDLDIRNHFLCGIFQLPPALSVLNLLNFLCYRFHLGSIFYIKQMCHCPSYQLYDFRLQEIFQIKGSQQRQRSLDFVLGSNENISLGYFMLLRIKSSVGVLFTLKNSSITQLKTQLKPKNSCIEKVIFSLIQVNAKHFKFSD